MKSFAFALSLPILLPSLTSCSDEARPTSASRVRATSASALVEQTSARFGLAWSARAHGVEDPVGSIPTRLDTGALSVRDSATGMELRFSLRGAGAASAESSPSVTLFRGAAPEGGDVFVRETDDGLEDFIHFERQPLVAEVRYAIELGNVAGLRLVDDVLEALDSNGTPRLRVARPYVIDRARALRRARLSIAGCAVDRDPRGPWGRNVVAPGNQRCELGVHFDPKGLAYPILLDPAWKSTGNMTAARAWHGMARLANGKVLAAGGSVPASSGSAELYDPATGTWATTGAMKSARSGFAMHLLKTNKVLAAAGAGAGIDKSETYDPATGVWTASGAMIAPHDYAASTLLGDGRVMVAGGGADNVSTELYDSATGAWTLTAPLSTQRRDHVLVTLGTTNNAKVLVVGGGVGAYVKATDTWDPTTGTWSSAGSLNEGRGAPGATRLNDGRVIVGGGSVGFNQRIASVEIFSPTTNSWSSGPAMSAGRAFYPMILLGDGRALAVAGGPPVSSTEVFNPTTNAWSNTGNLSLPREGLVGVLLVDGRVLVTGGTGNFGPAVDKAELFELVPNGSPCTLAAECASGFCADGVCCTSACTGACVSCKAVDQAAGTDGTCGPVKPGTDPSNDCKDEGSPGCGNNGFCDGAGACEKYPVSAGCTPEPCTSGSQCQSGFCEDGICCDAACGTCKACTAAKKGFGADGVCEAVSADSDPDDECAEGPNYPTSCLADGMCNGTGACRTFAKDTVSCGSTQCSGGSAQGLLCNGAGQCLTATTSCEPYVCAAGSCVQTCSSDNECVSSAFCTSQNTCLPKLTTGSACSAGKECQSGYCVDGICCGEPCGGQCEACNVAPNEGTCVPVTGAPVGSRPQCKGDDSECTGSCDGVNRTACAIPPSGQACGTPSCSGEEAMVSACDGTGNCVAESVSCSPFACGADACVEKCTNIDDCAQGFACNPTTGNCVPSAGKCLADGVTLETGPGETKNCSPYRCQGGECTDPCVTSSQCTSGFACDQGKCVKLESEAADDGGCGCRTSSGSATWSGFVALLGVALLGMRRRARSLTNRARMRHSR